MRKKISAIVLLTVLTAIPALAQHDCTDTGNIDRACCGERHCRQMADSTVVAPDISPSVLIVYFEKSNKPILKAAKKIGAEIVYTYRIINAVALRKPDTWSLGQTREYFGKVKNVVSVQYDHIYHLDSIQ